MSENRVVIGARGSRLSMWQANFVADRLREKQPLEIEIRKIKTTGDKILDSALSKIGDKGLFVKEIEVALSRGEIDVAIHSMKDVPTQLPDDLHLAATLERDDYHDGLISAGAKLAQLPTGATIGTSSLRRAAQLLNFRQDFRIKDVRGNVETRVRKMREGQFDAVILSAAGLDRLGMADLITERIPPGISLPAVGQGVVAVEARKDDERMNRLASLINHEETMVAVSGERSLMRELEGGCQVPIGALGRVDGAKFTMEGVVASLDGKRLLRDKIVRDSEDPEKTGSELADRLRELGADSILEEIRRASEMTESVE
ncbi:MAG: hydroxymethylbilane synthase [Terriglobia bacterium]